MGQEKKEKLTKMEIDWILYDVGNSAFVLLATTILPIYFNYLAGLAGVWIIWPIGDMQPRLLRCWWPLSVRSAAPLPIRRGIRNQYL